MKIDVFAVREDDGEEPTYEPLVSYSLPELDEIAKKDVVVKEGSTKPKVSLNFELSRSHLFKLNGATVSVDEKVIEEVVIEKKKEEKEETDAESKEEGNDTESAEKKEDEGEAEAEEANEEEAKEEVETEIRERIENHQFTVELEETLHNVRRLTSDQLAEARKRMKALEKRDEEKKLTDEAKNSYESLIYEFRGFLREEDNFIYASEADREALIAKTEEGEDWLYDAGSDVSYKVYQEKQYDLMSDYSKLKVRKEQTEEREREIPKYLELLAETKTKGIEVRESMPWVTE